MAFKNNEVSEVIDKLSVAQTLHAKIQAVQAASRIAVDDNDDLAITKNATVQEYLQDLRQKRDNKVAAAQAIAATWVP